jgi:hypothetical protein
MGASSSTFTAKISHIATKNRKDQLSVRPVGPQARPLKSRPIRHRNLYTRRGGFPLQREQSGVHNIAIPT